MLSKFVPNSPHLMKHLRKEHFISDKLYANERLHAKHPAADLSDLPELFAELEILSGVLGRDPGMLAHYLREKKDRK